MMGLAWMISASPRWLDWHIWRQKGDGIIYISSIWYATIKSQGRFHILYRMEFEDCYHVGRMRTLSIMEAEESNRLKTPRKSAETVSQDRKFYKRTSRTAQFSYPYKLNLVWSWWWYYFWIWTKRDSVWYKWNMKTIIIIHSVWNELWIYISMYEKVVRPVFVQPVFFQLF